MEWRYPFCSSSLGILFTEPILCSHLRRPLATQVQDYNYNKRLPKCQNTSRLAMTQCVLEWKRIQNARHRLSKGFSCHSTHNKGTTKTVVIIYTQAVRPPLLYPSLNQSISLRWPTIQSWKQLKRPVLSGQIHSVCGHDERVFDDWSMTTSQKRYDHGKGLLRKKYSARIVQYCNTL